MSCVPSTIKPYWYTVFISPTIVSRILPVQSYKYVLMLF